MAAKRIPALTEITAAGVANDDYFVIYDSSTDTTKKIAKSELSTLLSTGISASAILALLLTVDGPGSGLDADTLDGVNAAAFALLAGAAFGGNVSTSGNLSAAGTLTVSGKTSLGPYRGTPEHDDVGAVTLAADNANEQLFLTGNPTIPSGVFTKGQMIAFHNDGSDRKLNRGSGLTMYSDGTNSAEVWIRPFRSAMVIFTSATVCRIIGGTTTPPP